jgi:hypothetical protein
MIQPAEKTEAWARFEAELSEIIREVNAKQT